MEFNGDDSKITGDKAIANGFNNFFVNIGPSLAKRIPKCNDILFTQYLPDKVEDTMFLQPVTEEDNWSSSSSVAVSVAGVGDHDLPLFAISCIRKHPRSASSQPGCYTVLYFF